VTLRRLDVATAVKTGTTANGADAQVLDAVIVGAGFAGLYQLHLLRDRLKLKVRVLEAGEGIGGTWYWNRYPGARCDSESHGYCYAFSDDLVRDWEWSERYPGHEEIRRYLNYVADRLDLKRDIRLSTRVTGARYDEAAKLWTVETERGERFRAQFLVAAVGCLSTANVPKIPGLETFKGRTAHTGRWPHEGVDFTGLRVGVIGTGSTGIQAIPVIAEEARHLTVFQRTANYSVPARNGPLSAEFKREIRDNFAHYKQIMHETPGGHPFPFSPHNASDLTEEQRQRALEAAWDVGGLRFRSAFRDMVLSKESNAYASDFLKQKIRDIVKDPKTANLLADIDHPYGGKRPPIDTDYFETYNRPNVTLVDVKSSPIEAITPSGIQTRDQHYELDYIVFATGFDAMTGGLIGLDIRGRDGLRLADAWQAGPRNYLGLQVAGFPNLFTVTGPGSPSVLTNMPVAIEQHVEWIADCIAHLRDQGLRSIETTAEAMDRWVGEVNDAARVTLLGDISHSWYLGANIPGKPRVFMPYAGGMPKYRQICADVVRRGYEGFVLSR
jgi:cation diffusion facilitator CzcD-associated flavoprotein CzcO